MRDAIYLSHQYTRMLFEKIWVSLYRSSHQSFFFAKQREFWVLQHLKRTNQCSNVTIIQRFFINAALRSCVAVYYLSFNSEYFHVVCFVALYRHCCCFVELFSCVNLQSSRVFFCAFVVAKYLMSRNVLLRLALLCKLHQTHVSQTFYTRVLLRLALLCRLHQTRVFV